MVATHLHDSPLRPRRRHPEWVLLTLHHEHRDFHRLQLGKASSVRAAWRVEREREAEYRHGACLLHGAAGHPRPQGATPDDELQPVQLVRAQMVHDGDPGGVQLAGRSRRAPAAHTVGLLDQRDAELLGERGLRHGREISRFHAAAGSMTEDEGCARTIRRMQMNVCGPVRSLHREHQRMIAQSGSSGTVRP